MDTQHTRDPTNSEMLKEASENARQDLDDFLGAQDTVSGKFDEKLAQSNTDADGNPRPVTKANIDRDDSIKHISKASELTGTGQFNIQNKVLIFAGTILALALLVPITTYIMIFDLKNIIAGFATTYKAYTFTTIFIVGFISTIIVALAEFLYLGQFNKKNRETKSLEKTILIGLLLMQFGSHAYFAYLITGVQNTEKKEKIMSSAISTDGIKTKAINNTVETLNKQIEAMQKDLDTLSNSYKIEEKTKQDNYKAWAELNKLSRPTKKQARKRRNYYTLYKNAEESMDKILAQKEKKQKEIDKLTEKVENKTNSLTTISSKLDKELDESGFWRIIYIIILLILFEGLSHLNWLGYYRIIKNAPQDLVEDYREMSYVLNWGKTFANKTQEAIAIIAGQQIRLADDQLNNVKLTGKSFEYQSGATAHLAIEGTKGAVASMMATTNAMRQNTKGIILLANTIKKEGFSDTRLDYKEREDGKKVDTNLSAKITKFAQPPSSLQNALDFLVEEFQPYTKPKLQIAIGETGGYCDPLTDIIVIGEAEREKLTVLAHEFCHHLGYVQHDKEFRELEESIIKGLETWLKQTQPLHK